MDGGREDADPALRGRALSGSYGQNKRRRQKLRAFLFWLKTGCRCARCREAVHPVALDFDHDGDKDGSVTDVLNKTATTESLLREIAKCGATLCSNCHRLKTNAPEEYAKIPVRRRRWTMAWLRKRFDFWERRCWNA